MRRFRTRSLERPVSQAEIVRGRGDSRSSRPPKTQIPGGDDSEPRQLREAAPVGSSDIPASGCSLRTSATSLNLFLYFAAIRSLVRRGVSELFVAAVVMERVFHWRAPSCSAKKARVRAQASRAASTR